MEETLSSQHEASPRHPIEAMVEAKLRLSADGRQVEIEGGLEPEMQRARRISSLDELNSLAARLVVLGYLLEEKHRSPAAAAQVIAFVTKLVPALSRFLGAPKGARWSAAQAFLKKEGAVGEQHTAKGLKKASGVGGVGFRRRRPK